MLGLGLLFDFIAKSISGKSFFSNNKLKPSLKKLFFFSVIVALIMEISGNILGNFWYYPYYNFWEYIVLIFFNFFTYCILLMESFWGFKSIMSLVIKEKPAKKKLFYTTKLARNLWIIILVSLFLVWKYQNFPETLDSFINAPFANKAPLYVFVLFGISLWLFFEALAYIKNKETVLLNFLERKPVNLLAALSASVIVSVMFEYYNLFFQFWIYDNVPFPKLLLFRIPIAIFIVWPLQYVAIVPLYNLFFKRQY